MAERIFNKSMPDKKVPYMVFIVILAAVTVAGLAIIQYKGVENREGEARGTADSGGQTLTVGFSPGSDPVPTGKVCGVSFSNISYWFEGGNGAILTVDSNGNLYIGSSSLSISSDPESEFSNGVNMYGGNDLRWAFNSSQGKVAGSISNDITSSEGADDILFKNSSNGAELALFEGSSGDIQVRGTAVYDGSQAECTSDTADWTCYPQSSGGDGDMHYKDYFCDVSNSGGACDWGYGDEEENCVDSCTDYGDSIWEKDRVVDKDLCTDGDTDCSQSDTTTYDDCSGDTVYEQKCDGDDIGSPSSTDCRDECYGNYPGDGCSNGGCTKGSECPTGCSSCVDNDGCANGNCQSANCDQSACSGPSGSCSDTAYCGGEKCSTGSGYGNYDAPDSDSEHLCEGQCDGNGNCDYATDCTDCNTYNQNDCRSNSNCGGTCSGVTGDVSCNVDYTCSGDSCVVDSYSADSCTDNDGDGHVPNNCPDNDCYDENASAFTGQDDCFGSDRGDGSFDYNCDGQNNTCLPETTSSVTCGLAPGCEITSCTSGWMINVPSCGGSGRYLNCSAWDSCIYFDRDNRCLPPLGIPTTMPCR